MLRLRTKLLIERIITIVVIMALALGLFLKYQEERTEDFNKINEEISEEYIQVADNVIPAVVAISTLTSSTGNESKNFGSGFIVDEEGYILTSAHVITNGTNISVTLPDKRIYPAKIIGFDSASDVGLIKIEDDNLPVAKLGNSDESKVGEKIVAIGNPLGFQFTITSGIISAKNRDRGPTIYKDFIQIDAPIIFGNSGGPLVNLEGEVIGINTFIVTSNAGTNLGFSVPINLARKVMESLMEKGRVDRGFLGVNVKDIINLDETGKGRIEEGAKVVGLFKESPAEKTGIKVNDTITYLNEVKIEDSNHLKNIIAWIPNGTEVNIKIKRIENEKERNLEVKVILTERPDDAN